MRARKLSEINHFPQAPPVSRLADMKARQGRKISELREALVSAGFETLRQQAAALGLSPSTAWAVMEGDQKASGLSGHTIKRILASPHLPAEARRVIEEYVCEKLLGGYGHSQSSLKLFRKRLGYPTSKAVPATQFGSVRNARASVDLQGDG
jgi:hypothetical protein